MRPLTRALALLALAALVLGLLASAVTLSSDHVSNRVFTLVLGVAIGAAWIGTGLYAWWRRSANRVGALMTTVGFASMLGAFTGANAPAVFTAGVLLGNVYLAVFAHLVLAYPEGRLPDRRARRVVGAGYVVSVLGPLAPLLVGWEHLHPGRRLPRSVIEVSSDERLGRALDVATSLAAVILVVVLGWLLLQRWRDATGPRRRAMGPLAWSGLALLALLALSLSSTVAGFGRVSDVLSYLGLAVFGSVPFVFLVGLLRSRVARADAVGELLLRLGELPHGSALRALLADALGDASLTVAYWIEDGGRWVDADGHAIALPSGDDPERAWTAVEIEGRRVGAIVHDVSLCEEPELVRSVAAAAGLLVANERLQAQLRARVDELRSSRARVLEAGVAERRRLERNLHDGAQQRLVALSLTLRLAQGKVRKDPGGAETLLTGAQDELARALGELRELARGIHPAVLSDRGLGPALEALAGRSPVPVELDELPPERLPEPVEAAAYFVVAEALTNVVKYAQASSARVAVRRRNGHAEVEVADDGIGGADPGHGTGLRGLADRLAALDGSLELDSPPGAGTRLRAQMPV